MDLFHQGPGRINSSNKISITSNVPAFVRKCGPGGTKGLRLLPFRPHLELRKLLFKELLGVDLLKAHWPPKTHPKHVIGAGCTVCVSKIEDVETRYSGDTIGVVTAAALADVPTSDMLDINTTISLKSFI